MDAPTFRVSLPTNKATNIQVDDVSYKRWLNMKKIKSKKEIIQYAGESYVRTIETYNEQGQLIFSKETNAEGKVMEEVSYEYNNQGLLATEHFKDSSGISQEYQFSYDEEEKIAELIIHYSNGGKEIQRYKREPNLEVLTVTDESGKIDRVETRSYNESGKLLSFRKEEEGDLVEEQDYAYDEEQRVTEKRWSETESAGHVKYSYSIDEDGDAVTQTYDANTNELLMIETLVEKENVTETIQEIIGYHTILKQVDKANNTETREVENDEEQVMESEHTEFDEAGNPLKIEYFDVRGLGKNSVGDSDQYLIKEYEYEFWEK